MDTGPQWLDKKPEPLTEKPSLDAAKAAIRSVLAQDSAVDRKPASEWLDKLKNSIYAWEVCDQLLAAREGIDVSYLAANMLRQKIARNFNELPLEYYSSLKDSIINHLQASEDYAVQGQLTMAVADLTLLLQAWKNPIEDLAKQLELDQSLSTIAANDLMAIYKGLHNRLLFAYILNQMCDLNHNHSERPCRVGARRREEYEDYLISKCGQTIVWWLNTLGEVESIRATLINVNNNQSISLGQCDSIGMAKCLSTIEKLVGQIYLCYSAWLRIFDEENVNDTLVLIDMAFRHLANLECPDMIHKYAVEAVVATSNFCDDNRNVDYLVNHLVKQVYTLEQPFRQSVATEDLEKSSNFVKTFTSVAEVACMTHVIENRDFKLLELLLGCLGHYDFEVVEETYSFWWIFIEFLQNRLNFSEFGPFVEYVNRFVLSVTKMCQFDPDEDSVIDQEQDIHAFRSSTAEIISNVMFISPIDSFLRDNPVLDTLRMDITKIPWEKLEATLFLLHCFAQMMSNEENHIRMQIFNSILTQQTGVPDIQTLISTKQFNIKVGTASGEIHPQIVATSLQIIGSFEGFLALHPDHLALAINYILTSISSPTYRNQLIKFAASALSNIMQQNANLHFSSCPELLVIVKDLCANLDQYDERAANELLKCSAFLANAIKESNLKDQFLCEIMRPSLESLKNTVNGPKTEDMMPSKYLDRLSVLFSLADLQPAIVPELRNLISLIDGELWPMIVKVLQVYAAQSGHTIERACRTIRYILRCLKPEWMIQQVAELMINLYKTYPQNSSPLYICSILVDEFANRSPEINQGLFAMLEIFCTLTFTLLNMEASQSQSLLTMKNYPETIDDMMRLFNRFLKKCPNDFVNCKALESIIELSISSLRIDHQDANNNVSKFVASFISLASNQEYPRISDAIRNVLGARFVDAVIRACLFDIPSHLISDEAQILLTLHSFDKDLFNSWVGITVTNLPKTNIQGIESVTSDQLEDFKKAITTAGSLKEIVNSLRAFARLYN